MLVEVWALLNCEFVVTGLQSRLRTVDVAGGAGYSVQQIRDLERVGVLPTAERSSAGHRRYSAVHLHAALAYRSLAEAVGPVEAKRLMRAAHRSPPSELLVLLDEAHARLHRERGDLAQAREAAAAIRGEPVEDARPSDAMTISELAEALGVRTSTLRHWDAEGLVVPRRTAPAQRRIYSPRDVREARIVHELRRAGYGVGPLRELLPQLQRARRGEEVVAALAARDASLTARSRALLRAAAALEDLLVGGT